MQTAVTAAEILIDGNLLLLAYVLSPSWQRIARGLVGLFGRPGDGRL